MHCEKCDFPGDPLARRLPPGARRPQNSRGWLEAYIVNFHLLQAPLNTESVLKIANLANTHVNFVSQRYSQLLDIKYVADLDAAAHQKFIVDAKTVPSLPGGGEDQPARVHADETDHSGIRAAERIGLLCACRAADAKKRKIAGRRRRVMVVPPGESPTDYCAAYWRSAMARWQAAGGRTGAATR